MAPYRQRRLLRIDAVFDISNAHGLKGRHSITPDRTRRGDACIIGVSDIGVDTYLARGHDSCDSRRERLRQEAATLVLPTGDKA